MSQEKKCPFSKIFGTPGEGVHSTRFLGYAVVDTVLTVLVAYLTTFVVKIEFVNSLIIWLVVGEVMHYTYGVQTAFLTAVGIKVAC